MNVLLTIGKLLKEAANEQDKHFHITRTIKAVDLFVLGGSRIAVLPFNSLKMCSFLSATCITSVPLFVIQCWMLFFYGF
jgi:hypothetical protein